MSRDGRVIYRFRKAWRNGKQAVVMDGMTFLSRLAAQVPPPRFHMLSYYGVLAPAALGRSEIVPGHGDGLRSEGSGCMASQQAALPVGAKMKRLGVTAHGLGGVDQACVFGGCTRVSLRWTAQGTEHGVRLGVDRAGAAASGLALAATRPCTASGGAG